ncbi:DUF4118 domain-containing protein [Dactylosporangium sp. CA-233914]|uniref:sensor histidine kinase n=1 Tax=Dactylosporangium sp. CA-233914 TaxID=3239934 RepID=UPI003D8BDB0F
MPSLLLRPTQPPLALGLVVAALLIVAETLVLYPLAGATHASVRGVVYLLGVLVVSVVWGAKLGVVTSVASALTFDYYHVPPFGAWSISASEDAGELAFFVFAGVLTSGLAGLARSRALEASERSQAGVAAELAGLVLGADDVRAVLGAASQRLAAAFELPWAVIALEVVGADERRAALPLRVGANRSGTLLVPADLSARTLVRLRQRVVPSLETLLCVALERQVSRERFCGLVEEQTALRRVATMVARGASPAEVFSAVAAELSRHLNLDTATLMRYEPDGTALRVAGVGKMAHEFSVTLEGDNVTGTVRRTGRAARMNNYDNAAGSLSAMARSLGIRASVAAPVVVEGRLWGAAVVLTSNPEPIPADAEARLADFTELVAAAIANADSRAQLTASRARIVAASDEARRRFERDLHDGAQQRLISLCLELHMAEAALPLGLETVKEQLSRTAKGLTGVFDDLREIAHGIHPAILSKGGLGPALKTLARRSGVPVELHMDVLRRLPECVEVAAYYVVSEALANATKHARASMVQIDVEAQDAILQILTRDDGIGGADPGKGSGLIGLQDRVETLGGHMEIVSPAEHGTTLRATIPISGG